MQYSSEQKEPPYECELILHIFRTMHQHLSLAELALLTPMCAECKTREGSEQASANTKTLS